MKNKQQIAVDVLGLHPGAPGGFKADAEVFSTYLPALGVGLRLIGYTRGVVKGEAEYCPVLTRFFPHMYLIYFLLFFVAPFLPIRKGSIIMVNRIPDVLPFVIFYPRHPKVCRMTGPNASLKLNHSRALYWIYLGLERLCVPFVRKFIVVDHLSRDYLRRRYGIPEEKIVLIPVMPDLQVFRPLDRIEARRRFGFGGDEKICLYIGRLTRAKNLELLLEAYDRVAEMGHQARLVIAGDGPHRHVLEDLSKHVRGKVTFTGHVDHDNVPWLLNCADVFTFPSLTEGSPNVVKEALACGVPVVSTRVGDVPEYVKDGLNGYVVDPEIESFANGLLRALDTRERLRRGALACRDALDAQRVMEAYVRVFQEIV